MPRSKRHKRLRTKYTVLGDGLTEQYYLKHLKAIKGYKYSIYPSLFDAITIESAETKIDELLSGGCDLIVYFTDFDTIITQVKEDKFVALKKKYADIPEVLICESMPCFEFWLVLHFNKTTREFRSAGEVAHELRKFMTRFRKRKNFLEKSGWVEELCSEDRLETAIKNATEILDQKENHDTGKHFPFTRVHSGIEVFEKHKNDPN